MRETLVVGVPTFRRPKSLERLLKSLSTQGYEGGFSVLVVDNDPERREGEDVVKRLNATSLPYKLSCSVAAERGISHARNAILRYALEQPDARFLAMIDDDEWATEQWLSSLVQTMELFTVDVVGGPAIRTYPEGTAAHIIRVNTIADKSPDTRTIRSLESTANILLRLSTVRRMGFFFDPDFGLTGGSDRDLLLRMRLAGAKFAWSAEAVVYEEFPSSRCTPQWAVQRAYRVGNTEMLAYLKNRPPRFAAKETIKISLAYAQSLGYLSVAAISPYHFLRAKVLAARATGKIAALFGSRYYEYNRTHGS